MARFLAWIKRCLLLVALMVIITLMLGVLLNRKIGSGHDKAAVRLSDTRANLLRPAGSNNVNAHAHGKENQSVAGTSFISGINSVSLRDRIKDRSGRDCNDASRTSNISNKRFVLAWMYFEQLTMATTNLFSLMWYASKMQAFTVMPFTYKSQMFGLPRLMSSWKRDSRLHPLRLLYDLQKLNKLACKYKLPLLVDFQEFLKRGSRRLIIIHLIYYSTDTTRLSHIGGPKKGLLKALHNHHMIECCSIVYITRIVAVLGSYLRRESLLSNTNNFQVHRCLCVNASLPSEPDDLLKLAGLHDSTEFSIIFTDWRGISSSDIPKKTSRGTLRNFRMLVPSAVRIPWPHPSRTVFPTSTMVRRNATNFLKRAAGGKKFITIHFRSEKIGQVEKRIPFFTESCFVQATILRDEILSKETELVTLYFSDYGDYGSSTCRSNCRGSKKLRALFKTNKLQVTHFYPNAYKAVPDSGFVALVEQEAMASAHILVLVGGGSFQSQLEQRFKMYNRGGVVHRVCWNDHALRVHHKNVL